MLKTADVKHSRNDFANCTPSASVTNGRTLLGHHQCAALTPDRELIGVFADRATASFAVGVHHDIASP